MRADCPATEPGVEAVVVRDLEQRTSRLPASYVRILDPTRRPTAALPAAAYLSLHDDHWRRLPAPPAGLAAAKPAGQDSLARAVGWAEWLGTPVPAEVLRWAFQPE